MMQLGESDGVPSTEKDPSRLDILAAKAATEGASYLTDIDKILNEIDDSIIFVDKSFKDLVNTMGRGENYAAGFGKVLEATAKDIILAGGKREDAIKIQTETINIMGRASMLSQKQATDLFNASKVTGVASKDLTTAFLDSGRNLSNISKEMLVVRETAQSLGVNAKQVSSLVTSNLDKLNRFTFRGGVEGLAKMAAHSSSMRIEMESAFQLADDLMDPEKAIEMASEFQRLGVASADLTNPLKLMSMEAGELQEKLGEAMSKYVTIGEDGTKTISKMGVYVMKQLASSGVMTRGELEKLGIGTREMQDKMSKISFAGLNLDEDTQKLIANVAQLGEGGTYEIQTTDENNKIISKSIEQFVQDLGGDQEKIRQALLSQEQKTGDASKDMGAIAQGQLDALTTMTQQNALLLASIGFTVSAGKMGPELLKASVELNKFINTPILKNIGSESDLGKGIDNTAVEIKNALEEFKSGKIGTDSLMKLLQDFGGAGGKLAGQFGETGMKIVKDYAEELGIGEDVVDNIIQGIKEGLPEVKEQGLELLYTILDGINVALEKMGIEVPDEFKKKKEEEKETGTGGTEKPKPPVLGSDKTTETPSPTQTETEKPKPPVLGSEITPGRGGDEGLLFLEDLQNLDLQQLASQLIQPLEKLDVGISEVDTLNVQNLNIQKAIETVAKPAVTPTLAQPAISKGEIKLEQTEKTSVIDKSITPPDKKSKIEPTILGEYVSEENKKPKKETEEQKEGFFKKIGDKISGIGDVAQNIKGLATFDQGTITNLIAAAGKDIIPKLAEISKLGEKEQGTALENLIKETLTPAKALKLLGAENEGVGKGKPLDINAALSDAISQNKELFEGEGAVDVKSITDMLEKNMGGIIDTAASTFKESGIAKLAYKFLPKEMVGEKEGGLDKLVDEYVKTAKEITESTDLDSDLIAQSISQAVEGKNVDFEKIAIDSYQSALMGPQEELKNITTQEVQPEIKPEIEFKVDTSEVENLNVKNLNIGDAFDKLISTIKLTPAEQKKTKIEPEQGAQLSRQDKIRQLEQQGLVGEDIASADNKVYFKPQQQESLATEQIMAQTTPKTPKPVVTPAATPKTNEVEDVMSKYSVIDEYGNKTLTPMGRRLMKQSTTSAVKPSINVEEGLDEGEKKPLGTTIDKISLTEAENEGFKGVLSEPVEPIGIKPEEAEIEKTVQEAQQNQLDYLEELRQKEISKPKKSKGKFDNIKQKGESVEAEEPSAYENYKKLLEEINNAKVVGQGEEAFFLTPEMVEEGKKGSELIGPETQEPTIPKIAETKVETKPIGSEIKTPKNLIRGEKEESGIQPEKAKKPSAESEPEKIIGPEGELIFDEKGKDYIRKNYLKNLEGEEFNIPEEITDEDLKNIYQENSLYELGKKSLEYRYKEMKAGQLGREAKKAQEKGDENKAKELRKKRDEYIEYTDKIDDEGVESNLKTQEVTSKPIGTSLPISEVEEKKSIAPVPEIQEEYVVKDKDGNIIGTSSTERTARLKGEKFAGGKTESMGGFTVEKQTVTPQPPETPALGVEKAAAETEEKTPLKERLKEGFGDLVEKGKERFERSKLKLKADEIKDKIKSDVEEFRSTLKKEEPSKIEPVFDETPPIKEPKTLRERIEEGAEKLGSGVEKFAGKIGEKFEGSKLKAKIDEIKGELKPQEEPSKIEPVVDETPEIGVKTKEPQILSEEERKNVENFLYSKNPFTGENVKYDAKTVEYYKQKGIDIPEEYREGGKETKNEAETKSDKIDVKAIEESVPKENDTRSALEKISLTEAENEGYEGGIIEPVEPVGIKPQETKIDETVREAKEQQLSYLEELRLQGQTPETPARGVERLYKNFSQTKVGKLFGSKNEEEGSLSYYEPEVSTEEPYIAEGIEEASNQDYETPAAGTESEYTPTPTTVGAIEEYTPPIPEPTNLPFFNWEDILGLNSGQGQPSAQGETTQNINIHTTIEIVGNAEFAKLIDPRQLQQKIESIMTTSIGKPQIAQKFNSATSTEVASMGVKDTNRRRY